MRDFNLPGIKRESDEANGNEEKFLECIQDSFFTQHVLLPTRGDNIMDLVISNEEVENLTVGEPFGTSDRCVIKWDMVIKKRNKNYNRVIFDYFNMDYAQLREIHRKLIGVK